MYSMGTPVSEEGGKGLGSKEGMEGGGEADLQSWGGRGIIDWPDPRQHWNKKDSPSTLLTIIGCHWDA